MARTARDLDEQDSGGRRAFVPAVAGLARTAIDMLHGALDALVRLDLVQAEKIRRADDTVDAAFAGCIRQIAEHMAGNPDTVGTGVKVLFAAKGLERIGDHAKNIAEAVVQVVKGIDVRHATAEQIRAEVAEE